MLFAWIGYLKPGVEIPQEVNQETGDFVQQPFIDIRSFGPLYDGESNRSAMLMIFEVEDRVKAETFVVGSPYLQAGLYDKHQLYEYRNEGG